MNIKPFVTTAVIVLAVLFVVNRVPAIRNLVNGA